MVFKIQEIDKMSRNHGLDVVTLLKAKYDMENGCCDIEW